MSRWARELRLGARLALAGGRGSWTRAAMTAVGVGLGVALLLFAASIPNMISARDERVAARDDLMLGVEPPRGARTLLLAYTDTSFRDVDVRGRVLQAEGPLAPVPPGVAELPGPGEMVVSPPLARLLASSDGALLRERLPYRVVGTIGDAGLEGPSEHAYYAGSDRLVAGDEVRRTDRFGSPSAGEGLDPVLGLLAVIAFAVLLLPVAVFIGAAARFGGEARDRRLAALRLVGADVRMTRRIAAGEALLGALLGIAFGAAVFLLTRTLVERLELAGLSAFAGDVRPSAPLVALIVLAVPVGSVAVTLLALRGVAIEPLGVVRRGRPRRRRVWWRLLPPLAGGLLLLPLLRVDPASGETFDEYQVAAGVVLLLIGISAILPWLVEAVVHRLGGGGVAWQLATRRLQLDSGASARVVSGIAVAVAGAIALQTLFTGIESNYTTSTGADLDRADASVTLRTGSDGQTAREVAARLRAFDGVTSVVARDEVDLRRPLPGGGTAITALTVAGCGTLRELARVRRCADGDAFLVRGGEEMSRAGDRVQLGEQAGDRIRWTVPEDARPVAARQSPTGDEISGVLLTPKAARGLELPKRRVVAYLGTDPSRRDALDEVRNATLRIDPLSDVLRLTRTRQVEEFTKVRRGLFAGAVAVLLLIGASMLVSALEQLRERRRVLAVLVAFGTPRGTLGWSILWQTAVPVALGLALAVGTGAVLGALLLKLVGESLSFDLASIAGMTAIGGGVVLLVTALSMPALWRLMRPEGLRTE